MAFRNEEDRRSFSRYYTPTVEIKYYNVIIDGEPLYEIAIKNKEETYKAITELIRNDLLRTGNEFNFEYFCEHYKLIAIDLSKQKLILLVDKNKMLLYYLLLKKKRPLG